MLIKTLTPAQRSTLILKGIGIEQDPTTGWWSIHVPKIEEVAIGHLLNRCITPKTPRSEYRAQARAWR